MHEQLQNRYMSFLPEMLARMHCFGLPQGIRNARLVSLGMTLFPAGDDFPYGLAGVAFCERRGSEVIGGWPHAQQAESCLLQLEHLDEVMRADNLDLESLDAAALNSFRYDLRVALGYGAEGRDLAPDWERRLTIDSSEEERTVENLSTESSVVTWLVDILPELKEAYDNEVAFWEDEPVSPYNFATQVLNPALRAALVAQAEKDFPKRAFDAVEQLIMSPNNAIANFAAVGIIESFALAEPSLAVMAMALMGPRSREQASAFRDARSDVHFGRQRLVQEGSRGKLRAAFNNERQKGHRPQQE